MFYLWYIRYLLLHLLYSQYYIQYTTAIWPISNFSNLRLLGLFPDVLSKNTSETDLLSIHSLAMFKAAILLSQKYNLTIGGQYLGWEIGQTDGNMIGALNSTCAVMSTTTIFGIIGPAYSREAHVIATLGKTIGIPVISYAATDPELSHRSTYPAFYRTVPSDNTAAFAVVKLFNQFSWTSCMIIYQNDEFGSGGADAINDIFGKNGLTVTDTLIYDIATLKFREDLKKTLSSSSSRIVLLWTETRYTSLILQNALDTNSLGPLFLWILRSSISLKSFNQIFYPNLIGILTIEPVVGYDVDALINTTLLNEAFSMWKQYEPETFPGPMNVTDDALFAFDATWLLIQSLHKLCSTIDNVSSSCLSSLNTSVCFDRRFVNTTAFFNMITATEFLGVSGLIKFNVNRTDRVTGNYYLLQNIQSSSNGIDYVSVLKWSDDEKWKPYALSNVIVWPGNSWTIPSGHPDLLDVHLRIGVIESPPFFMITNIIDTSEHNTTKYIGYVPDLINLLQTRMRFIPDIILTPSNQTYDGLIQAVANGVYDIVIGDVTVTAKRREIVDFSSTIFDNSMRIITRQSIISDVDLFAFMKPFSIGLWLTLLAATIYAGILICLLERQSNETIKEKSVVSSGTMSIWYSYGTLMGYGVDFDVRTAAGRLLTAGLYVLSLILVATYTANLASNLTISKSKGIISGIDDIKNGMLPFNRIGILVGSSLEDYYLREISGGSRNFYPLKTVDELYSDLQNSMIDASIFDTGILEYATSTLYCNLTLVGSDFSPSAYGIVIPKQWIYSQILDVNILSLREDGALDDLKRKWFEGKSCPDSSSSSSNTPTSISLTAMAGLFLTFAIISILSILLFAWTKRLIIKKYFWTAIHRTKSLVQYNDSAIEYSTKPECNFLKDSETISPSDVRF